MKNAVQKIGVHTFVASIYLCPWFLAMASLESLEQASSPNIMIEKRQNRNATFDFNFESESEPVEDVIEQPELEPQPPETITTVNPVNPVDTVNTTNIINTANTASTVDDNLAEPETATETTTEAITEAVKPVTEAVAEAEPEEPQRTNRQRRRKRPCVQHTDSIVQLSNTRYKVKRDFVNSVANMRSINSLGRVSWHTNEDGDVDGFRVRRIRCGSPLHQAGIRNGDIVHTINGRTPRSLLQAINLWLKMRNKTFIRVRVTRNGERIKLRYRLI